MATYNHRRYAHADGLKAAAREHLLALGVRDKCGARHHVGGEFPTLTPSACTAGSWSHLRATFPKAHFSSRAVGFVE